MRAVDGNDDEMSVRNTFAAHQRALVTLSVLTSCSLLALGIIGLMVIRRFIMLRCSSHQPTCEELGKNTTEDVWLC
jgi:hypothetical protein